MKKKKYEVELTKSNYMFNQAMFIAFVMEIQDFYDLDKTMMRIFKSLYDEFKMDFTFATNIIRSLREAPIILFNIGVGSAIKIIDEKNEIERKSWVNS